MPGNARMMEVNATHDITHDLTPMTSIRKKKAPLVSFAEAARVVGIARQNIPGAIARGDLVTARDQTGHLRVTRASAERYRRQREAKAKQAPALKAG